MCTDRRDPADTDPQCPWLMQRIDELQGEIAVEAEGLRRQHWGRQLRRLTERARCLGCYDGRRHRPAVDAPPP